MAKVFCFAPHAGIWLHSFPESLVVESLHKQGHTVLYATCDELFNDYCVTMAAFGQEPITNQTEKAKTCRTCIANKKLLVRKREFEEVPIRSFLTEKDFSEIQEALETVDWSHPENWKFMGYHLGRVAIYEPLLKYKKSEIAFTEQQMHDVKAAIKTACLSLVAAEKALALHKPDVITTYNGLYGVNAAVRLVANKFKIPVISLHGSANLARSTRAMMLAHDHGPNWLYQALRNWNKFRDIPIGEKQIARVLEHFKILFSGKSVFVYSKPLEGKTTPVRSFFGVRDDQKILVATLSSYDERYGAETVGATPRPQHLLFPKLVDWIQELVKWAETRKDVFLIVRPHPRELPNKREGVKSEHLERLTQVLGKLPSNVKVNWPSDNISMYQLAHEATAFANAWSSVGAEMTLMGKPVVIYSSELPFYPAELNRCASTIDGYFDQLEAALNEPFSIEKVRTAFRWYYYLFEAMVVDLSDGSHLRVREQRSFIQKVFYKIEWKLNFNFMRRLDLFRRAKKLHESSLISAWFFKSQPPVDEIRSFRYPVVEINEETESVKKAHAELLRLIGTGRA